MVMTEEKTFPLVLTKLREPARRERSLARPRLTGQLGSGGFVLVCAPAGYGKTTLLAGWAEMLRQDGSAVVWYGLDADDNTPATFGAYLAAGVMQALGETPGLASAVQLLRADPEMGLQRLAAEILNAAAGCERACWLMVDDYHLVSAPAIHSAVAALLAHRPECLHVVLGSRSDPPLPLARLRASGQMVEIRAGQLRFTPEEALRFFDEVMQLKLMEDMVAALEERTEGWVTGLQLAGLSFSGRNRPGEMGSAPGIPDALLIGGRDRYLVDYLMEEVFERQPEETRSFLLETSVLRRLNGALCDAVLGRPGGSDETLAGLEQANLFVIALDRQGDWYRYHHLFGDFLQARLQRSMPGRGSELHRAACAWFAAHGSLREAAFHAFETRDWDDAAVFVEQNGFRLIIHSEIALLDEWCAAFPEEVMLAHPTLCLLQCWPWVLRFQKGRREKIEARLRQAEQASVGPGNAQLASDISEHAAVLRSFLAMAPDPDLDLDAQLAAAIEGIKRYPEGEPSRFSSLLAAGYAYLARQEAQAAEKLLREARQLALDGGLFYGVVESTFHLARLALSQGRLQEAEEWCKRGREDLAALLAAQAAAQTQPGDAQTGLEREIPAVGCLDIALGCVQLEQDRLAEAGQNLHRGLELIGWGMNMHYGMAACTALFQLKVYQGDYDEAAGALARLQAAWPDAGFYIDALRAGLALRGLALELPAGLSTGEGPGSGAGLIRLPEGEGWLPGMGPLGGADVYAAASLARAKALIAAGSPQAAAPYLTRQLALAKQNGLLGRAVELGLVLALAEEAGGRDEQAWAALEYTLQTARACGFVRSLDQGPAGERLLARAAERGIEREWVEKVLAAIQKRRPGQGEEEPAVEAQPASSDRTALLPFGEQISARELEILQLMARGATNQAIAAELVITVGTVKSHINHVLRKLDAHNRTEAVALARKLGLIEV